MEKSEKSIKAFNIPYEAWYKDTVLGEPHIYVGMYYESGGCDGKFRFVWEKIGIQLVCGDVKRNRIQRPYGAC